MHFIIIVSQKVICAWVLIFRVEAAQRSGPSNVEMEKKIRDLLTKHEVFGESSFWNSGRRMSVITLWLYINVKQYKLKKTFGVELWGGGGL